MHLFIHSINQFSQKKFYFQHCFGLFIKWFWSQQWFVQQFWQFCGCHYHRWREHMNRNQWVVRLEKLHWTFFTEPKKKPRNSATKDWFSWKFLSNLLINLKKKNKLTRNFVFFFQFLIYMDDQTNFIMRRKCREVLLKWYISLHCKSAGEFVKMYISH